MCCILQKRRCNGSFRPVEYVLYHLFHACHFLTVLESGTRKYSGGSGTGWRGSSDYAHIGFQHGMDFEMYRKRKTKRYRKTGARSTDWDEFYSLKHNKAVTQNNVTALFLSYNRKLLCISYYLVSMTFFFTGTAVLRAATATATLAAAIAALFSHNMYNGKDKPRNNSGQN